MDFGIIGLGKMGSSLALQSLEKGIKVIGKDPNADESLKEKRIRIVEDYDSFFRNLKKPRIIFLSLPAGSVIDQVIKEILLYVEEGDILIDGGNSYYKDSIRRANNLKEKGVYFVDCGTSGGVIGARKGASFMVGGEKEAIELCEPILKKLAVEGGFIHCGKSGSGHFVKLVHNGIEFGMLQAIGEGVELLHNSDFDLDLKEIFEMWSHGTVIRSWLIELMSEGLEDLDKISDIPDYIEDTGEVNWLVQEAINKEIPIPIITQSIIELFKSRKSDSNAYRAIAIMRHGFGGHPYGKDDYIAKERKTSRIHKL